MIRIQVRKRCDSGGRTRRWWSARVAERRWQYESCWSFSHNMCSSSGHHDLVMRRGGRESPLHERTFRVVVLCVLLVLLQVLDHGTIRRGIANNPRRRYRTASAHELAYPVIEGWQPFVFTTLCEIATLEDGHEFLQGVLNFARQLTCVGRAGEIRHLVQCVPQALGRILGPM